MCVFFLGSCTLNGQDYSALPGILPVHFFLIVTTIRMASSSYSSCSGTCTSPVDKLQDIHIHGHVGWVVTVQGTWKDCDAGAQSMEQVLKA